MKNTFKYSNDNKRYHTYNYYLKNLHNCKVAKVSLNANFTCPNRDGTKGYGGCTFCSDSGSGDFAGHIEDHLDIQFTKIASIMNHKWPGCKYTAYFQANTNTYGSIEKIKQCIEPFLYKNDVVEIVLGTRADCLNDEILEYLSQCNYIKPISLEIGLQTIHESTSNYINRCHSYDCFKKAILNIKKHKLHVCVHIINGLPNETKEMMIETIKEVCTLNIDAIKLHMLYIIRGTKIAKQYLNNEFTLLTREQYIDIVTTQLQYIPEHIVIERLTGDGNIDTLIEPQWSRKKVTIINDIDKYMSQHNLVQGCLIKEKIPN